MKAGLGSVSQFIAEARRIGPLFRFQNPLHHSGARQVTTAKTEAIRALNDQLRASLRVGGGGAVITTGVAALGHEVVARIFKTITIYDEFCNANDPVAHARLPNLD
jgi:hypothetical protein